MLVMCRVQKKVMGVSENKVPHFYDTSVVSVLSNDTLFSRNPKQKRFLNFKENGKDNNEIAKDRCRLLT